ncbi:MAG TPA: exonuclease SbcCD subunit D [Clostridiaceae bacterium]|nr:exonuclease SbcCD subunit D [Clostridiaceae bacterium]
MGTFSFLHCSDLHIGRRFHGFSLLEDQEHVLNQIITYAEERDVSAVVIAGDVFDSTTPSADAVSLADRFLCDLADICPVLLTAGNHDSPERLQFGSRLFARSNVHIAAIPEKKPLTVMFEDAGGPIAFDCLPFIRASAVRRFFPDLGIETCQDAVAAVLAESDSRDVKRRVLVAHQFVVGRGVHPEESESEIRVVGGSGEIESSVFDGYDYVALGHLHGPQRIGTDTVRYSGSPLKYSFSELKHEKSVLQVTFDMDGVSSLLPLPLEPLRGMLELNGRFSDLLADGERLQAAGDPAADAYIRVLLTDELPPSDAMNRLRSFYPYIVMLEQDRTGREPAERYEPSLPQHDPIEQFLTFFTLQTGSDMTERQIIWLHQAMAEAEHE